MKNFQKKSGLPSYNEVKNNLQQQIIEQPPLFKSKNSNNKFTNQETKISVPQQQTLPPQESQNIASRSKKIKKHQEWNDKYEIKNVSFPEQLVPSERLKKKYKVKISYRDGQGANHYKTVRFGHVDKKDFLDHKNESEKNKLVSKLSNTHNVFHPNFWRYHLLNTGTDLKQNYMNIINKIS